MILKRFAIKASEKSASFSIKADLKESKSLDFSAKVMMNSAMSWSFTSKWFSSSVHTLETNERYCSFSSSLMASGVDVDILSELFLSRTLDVSMTGSRHVFTVNPSQGLCLNLT